MDIKRTSSDLGSKEARDHFLARIGYKRMEHIVEPGLYSIGAPKPSSPVFVSANYTLSFDALRSSLKGVDGYILVLDTKGINVWCAAGKGTFGTDEIVSKVQSTGLGDIVSHRTLILPQLGAPGVSAHEVKKRTGFQVEYGPVRAVDLPRYLKEGKADQEMRTVRFPVKDRAVLAPVELRNNLLFVVLISVAAFFLIGWMGALAVWAAVLAGTILFPILLPFIPTKDFTSKGLILGTIVALAYLFLWAALDTGTPDLLVWTGYLLLMVPSVAYMALNFTGCTTFTSRTAVQKEIFRYIPALVLMAIAGLVVATYFGLAALMGWS